MYFLSLAGVGLLILLCLFVACHARFAAGNSTHPGHEAASASTVFALHVKEAKTRCSSQVSTVAASSIGDSWLRESCRTRTSSQKMDQKRHHVRRCL